jgi:hypothetical protein
VEGAWDGSPFGAVAFDCATPTGTTCRLDNLVRGATYRFRVHAVNAAGLGPASPESAPVVVPGARSLDGDRPDELMYIDPAGTVRAWRNVNAAAGFPYTEAPRVIATGFEPARTRFADIDGDGRNEIIHINADGTVHGWRNVTAGAEFPYPELPRIIATGFPVAGTRFADIDGDGRDEIVHIDPAGTAHAWRNVNGGAGFPYTGAPVVVATGFPALDTHFADLNGDGKDEIVYRDRSNTTSYFTNTGGLASFPYPHASTSLNVAYYGSGRLLTADTDGDNRDEIIEVGGGGFVTAWLVEPTALSSPRVVGTGFAPGYTLLSR